VEGTFAVAARGLRLVLQRRGRAFGSDRSSHVQIVGRVENRSFQRRVAHPKISGRLGQGKKLMETEEIWDSGIWALMSVIDDAGFSEHEMVMMQDDEASDPPLLVSGFALGRLLRY